MSERRLVVIGPLPPPVHGVAVSTSLVLANPHLRERFMVEHLDTSDHRPISTIGRWDTTNISLGLRHVVQLAGRLRGSRGVVYLPLSQSTGGLARDSAFIHVASAMGWKVAVHLRGGEFIDVFSRLPAPARALIRATLRRVDELAVMSPRLRRLFAGFLPLSRLAVAPNGTPDPFTGALPDRRDHTVLFLSNLRARKGVVPALDAALQVLSRSPDATFLFAGFPEDPAMERTLRDRAGPGRERIRFIPGVDQEARRTLLASASVFLFPPVQAEGHPRVVIEAMAAGLPVVTTDQGAIADTVVDGESGFVLHRADPTLLADRLLLLLGDDGLRQRMSKAARARYLELFTQERADLVLADWLERVAG